MVTAGSGMTHWPAVVTEACDERAQHDGHMGPRGHSVYLGGQLSNACAGRLPGRVIVCPRAAHVVFKHLHTPQGFTELFRAD